MTRILLTCVCLFQLGCSEKDATESEPEFYREFDRLWTELVPASGEAETVQGELVRCAQRLYKEWDVNGNMNWDLGGAESYKKMGDYLNLWLTKKRYGYEPPEELEGAIERIRTDAADEEDFWLMYECVVAFCKENPLRMPRKNPDVTLFE